MGMFNWTEKSSTVLQQGGVIAPDERLPWPQALSDAAVASCGAMGCY